MDVLQLDVSGRPQAWITPREAAVLYASDGVAWTLGDTFHVLRGGIQRTTGLQSRIDVHPIIAVSGAVPDPRLAHGAGADQPQAVQPRPPRVRLLRRAASTFDDADARARRPVSRGGRDTWMNCITACRGCNGRKGNRLPEEARMSLLYLPYVPNLHEDMILRGRRILADQMEFLLASVPRSSRLHA